MSIGPLRKEIQVLGRAGFRVTSQRAKILQVMEIRGDGKRQFSAEEIYRRMFEAGDPNGLGTIYRVLGQFEASGLVTRVSGQAFLRPSFFRREGGIDLGLAIVRQIITAHGDQITATISRLGGSLLRVCLPSIKRELA